jgi:hypothetical protein
MEFSRGAGGSGERSFDLDAELARLAALPLGERGTGLAELTRRLEAELDADDGPLPDAEGPV